MQIEGLKIVTKRVFVAHIWETSLIFNICTAKSSSFVSCFLFIQKFPNYPCWVGTNKVHVKSCVWLTTSFLFLRILCQEVWFLHSICICRVEVLLKTNAHRNRLKKIICTPNHYDVTLSFWKCRRFFTITIHRRRGTRAIIICGADRYGTEPTTRGHDSRVLIHGWSGTTCD